MKFEKQEVVLEKLANRIRDVRIEKGLRQEDFEDGTPLALNTRSYQEIEYGNASPGIYTLYKIARRLGVKVKDLIDF